MFEVVKVKVVDAKADYKGRLKLQFKVGDEYFRSTLVIISIAARDQKSEISRAIMECDIVNAKVANKRMKL